MLVLFKVCGLQTAACQQGRQKGTEETSDWAQGGARPLTRTTGPGTAQRSHAAALGSGRADAARRGRVRKLQADQARTRHAAEEPWAVLCEVKTKYLNTNLLTWALILGSERAQPVGLTARGSSMRGFRPYRKV